ncbi:helix-turn-helix DNA-binding protein [Mycobacterium phage BiancaTri92]|nr:helix-turn-helix DNA binding protein [Mycobacterium phage Leogania]QGJ90954.1 helix-turn-helix DNA-binding protein [Mycobacterium phage BiancaTri92]
MEEIFRKAAKAAMYAWKQNDDGIDDLVNDLWVWYLERPGTQKKLQNSDEFLARRLVYKAALQFLAGQSLDSDMFNGKSLYSSDNVKDALLGVSTNRYLVDILPRAMEALDFQNERQAESIRVRYEDGEVPPRGSAAEAMLKRAVKALTEHVNVIAITAGVDADGNVTEGPGSRHSVFPETRPTSGGHSDPTADIAILLIEHPELRDEYLYEPPISEFLGGRCSA